MEPREYFVQELYMSVYAPGVDGHVLKPVLDTFLLAGLVPPLRTLQSLKVWSLAQSRTD